MTRALFWVGIYAACPSCPRSYGFPFPGDKSSSMASGLCWFQASSMYRRTIALFSSADTSRPLPGGPPPWSPTPENVSGKCEERKDCVPLRTLFFPPLLIPPRLGRLARYLGPLLFGELFGADLAALQAAEPAMALRSSDYTNHYTNPAAIRP